MNRRIMALILAAAMALTLCGASVFAAEVSAGDQSAEAEDAVSGQESDVTSVEGADADLSADVDGEQADAEELEADEPDEEEADPWKEAEIAPDPVGSVSFANLASRMRENNFNLLALEETIASVEVIDYEKMEQSIREQLNLIADYQWMLVITGNSFAADSLGQSYDALRETFDDLRDGKIQEDNAAVVRQLRNAQNQIVMAGESLYIALAELELNDKALDRSLAALDRSLQELELRYTLGHISALTLQEAKVGRTTLVSGQQTLDMNISNYKMQLEVMIGAELTGNIQLQSLPQVTDKQLSAMDLEADLAAAKEASYTLFAAKRTLDDAQQEYKDAGKEYSYSEKKYEYLSAQHTWQSAQYTYSAAVQSFENSFRTLYNQVKDYQQILQAAKTALACEKDSYAATQLKYDQGSISQNKLLEAADEVSTAQDKVDSAAIDLLSAYNNYRWAVDYGILN